MTHDSMDKKDCGCKTGDKECDCKTDSCDCKMGEKVCIHHLIEPIFDKLPENLKDMMHSLATQKAAVLKELKAWADKNDQKELAEACEKKMEKIKKRLADES